MPADATAVAVTVTVTEASRAGFVTAWAAGTTQPWASTVNADGPGQTRAAGAVVPVSDSGITLFASASTHVVVDLAGYFTGESADEDTAGFFQPIVPERVLDTRESTRLAPGTSRDIA
ncbi:MAG TPA: SGNH/GDSL hydrolase family protein, partial [Ilumatobacteraceae bacterium]|nr:SGNH/GDSL hydrolase family protein [Ilumatobacteraceae bacterium]